MNEFTGMHSQNTHNPSRCYHDAASGFFPLLLLFLVFLFVLLLTLTFVFLFLSLPRRWHIDNAKWMMSTVQWL